jgi:hypothetical protein
MFNAKNYDREIWITIGNILKGFPDGEISPDAINGPQTIAVVQMRVRGSLDTCRGGRF